MRNQETELTGQALQEAARRLNLRQIDVAQAAGVSPRTVHRLFHTDGPLDARATTVEQIARVLGLGDATSSALNHPIIVVDLPLDRLALARVQLPVLFALYEIFARTSSKSELLAAMESVDPTRVSSVTVRDNELHFDSMGEGIRWGGDRVRDARVLDVGEAGVARAAAERYWRAIVTGQPVFQYTRSSATMEFVALSVPTDRETAPGVVTASKLGRYLL